MDILIELFNRVVCQNSATEIINVYLKCKWT